MFRALLQYLLHSNTLHLLYNVHMYEYNWPFYITLSRTCFDPNWVIIRAIKFEPLRMIYDYMFLLLEGNSSISACTWYCGTRKKFVQSESSTAISCTWKGTWVHGFHSLMKMYTHITCQIPRIVPPWWWLNQGRNMSEKV
jgi:hypothetical protein